MPILSPDGEHTVQGIGKGYIYVDNVAVVSNAGGWGWLLPTRVAGSGQLDTPDQGFYQYDYQTGQQWSLKQHALATNFFPDGAGHWVAHLQKAGGPSFDWQGNEWTDRAAIGMSYFGDMIFALYTGGLLLRTLAGNETTEPNPGEWTQLPSGGYFSRNYRGAYDPAGNWYAVGWIASLRSLCVFQPFIAGAPIWCLSGDQQDFYSDIRTRQSDGLMVVATSQTQGDTGRRIYALDIPNLRFNVNNGPWQPLTTQPPPPSDVLLPVHVDPLPRHIRLGYFFKTSDRFGDNPSAPGNCEVAVGNDSGYERATLPLVWMSAYPDTHGDVVYFDGAAWPDPIPPIPAGKKYGVQLYCDPDESFDTFAARARHELRRFEGKRVSAVCQAYDRNGKETNLVKLSNLQSLWPQFAREFDYVADVLLFSDGRQGGTRTHEELRPWHVATLEAIPPVPEPEPQPPEPTPEPPQPEPEPPMPPTNTYQVIYSDQTLNHPTEVIEVEHQDDHSGPPHMQGCVGLKRVSDGLIATVSNPENNVPYGQLSFKACNPGAGERFFNAGNQYVCKPNDTDKFPFLKSGGYGVPNS